MAHLQHFAETNHGVSPHSAVFPLAASQPALLFTDARCLPGSEGGAVYDACGRWVGIVALPLALTDGSAVDMNLVIAADVLRPWLAAHCRAAESPAAAAFSSPPALMTSPPRTPLQALPRAITAFSASDRPVTPASTSSASASPSPLPPLKSSGPPLIAAERSVVLIRVNSTWGSGIVVAADGFVLTNAHLLKSYLVDEAAAASLAPPPPPRHASSPSTFVSGSRGRGESSSAHSASASIHAAKDSTSLGGVHSTKVSTAFASASVSSADRSNPNDGATIMQPPMKASAASYEPPALQRGTSIFVRLMPFHHQQQHDSHENQQHRPMWARADLVYLSRGAWDVALLKIVPESSSASSSPLALVAIPPQLQPARCGQDCLVVGFPLIAPRSGLCATVTAGIVSRVVKVPISDHAIANQSQSAGDGDAGGFDGPLLLQSDAAVHNGNSGGALLAWTPAPMPMSHSRHCTQDCESAREKGGGGGGANGRVELIGMVTSNVRHSRRMPGQVAL